MKLPGLNYSSPVQFSRAQRLQLAVIPPVAASIAKLLYALNRHEVRNPQYLDDCLKSAGQVVIGIWHESSLMAAAHFHGHNFHVLTSFSFDGELAARLLACYKIESVRGSSSRGGAEGLIELQKALGVVKVVGLTMDGPRGPHREAKPGLATLAARTGASLLPAAFAPSRCWRLRSWDRFPIPKPFGRIICAFGPPIPAPPDESREAIEAARVQLQDALNALHQDLEREFAEERGARP